MDQILFWGATYLERKLKEFVAYYNEHQVHYAFEDGLAPEEKHSGKGLPEKLDLAHYMYIKHCHGLFASPIAA